MVQTIRAGGCDVACRIEGPASAPAVLMAHGILATHRMWDAVAARLAGDWRVVRYDLRGHGGTPATDAPYTMRQLADEALAVLDALGIARAHFMGTSLGGMFGQVLGATAGTRLHSLTLANTAAVQPAPQAWQERIRIALERGVAPLVEGTLPRWFTPSCTEAQPQLVEQVRTEALRTNVEGYVGCASAIRDLAHRDLLARIAVPTLVVAGEHDSATPLTESLLLEAEIAKSRLVVLPAAHQAAAECPDAFVAAWTEFQRHSR